MAVQRAEYLGVAANRGQNNWIVFRIRGNDQRNVGGQRNDDRERSEFYKDRSQVLIIESMQISNRRPLQDIPDFGKLVRRRN